MSRLYLSPNFTLAELVKSRTALSRGIDNTPGPESVTALRALARNVLQPVRERYGVPFSPSSGYRSAELNAAVGGAPDSQHTRGEAADFEVPGIANLAVARFIRDNLDFDQLILEFHRPHDPHAGWIHCSYTLLRANRRQVLTFDGRRYLAGLPEDPVAV
ncbi:D-Ala-D-Ala carboxypeptidase family metallohydrolase [Ferruginivarius sediminum]|uniref:Peptidase M15A n=1 Tax=Ferruginivarius sediminum TaxID=2661937 RepID=A0A369TCK0_9PROT|nr:D-Ala-D-Ala carboxypeptidase family metallohydrolase [Ferruginivarius sediminum]RDD63010.1 peptidase M15A [Ferruginivarius sediminum]